MSDHFDLVVIGGGPGGYSAALYGASAGLNVALVEKDALGGTCLNRGCIPAKAFLETAAVKRHVDHSSDFGIESGGAASVDFARTQARKQGIVDGLVKGIAAMCKGRKVEVFNGVGALGANRTVQVSMADGSSATISGDAVMLAAGSVPRLIPNFERGGPIMTSDEVLDLTTVPPRVAVIGGGAIGCEFASTFADLGSEVTILEGLPEDPPRARRRPRQGRREVVQEEEDRHPYRRDGQRAHPQRLRRDHGVVRRRRIGRGRCGRRLGRTSSVRRPTRPRRHGCRRRRAWVRAGRRVLPDRRAGRVRRR